jgi:hypothetical protein
MIEPTWRAELVERIDHAISVAQELRNTPSSSEPNAAALDKTLSVLAGTRQKTIDCHLPPPNGRTTLGLARWVTDWIEDLNSPLVRAVSAVEKHYLKIPPEVPAFPLLADLTLVMIYADGHTTPPVPDGQAFITIQDKAVFTVGIWRRGTPDDFGGWGESPANEAALIGEAHDLVVAHVPAFLRATNTAKLICPAGITERMVWPEDHLPGE